MTLKPMGRAALATILSLSVALGITACSNDYTVSYVYMATAKTLPHGLINIYQVDYQSGNLLALADSPVDAGGRDTAGLVAAPNHLFLYTVNNFDSDAVEFAIGTDGKLYPQNTYNITGSLPTAVAIDSAGKYLYVAFTYQNNANGTQLYSLANPGPGGITIFPIASDNTLCGVNATVLNPKVCTQNATTVNVGLNPTGIATVTGPSGSYVYVLDRDPNTSANVLGFAENTSTGALTALSGTLVNPAAGDVSSTGYPSGPNPSGILGDATGTHLYVTDQTLNELFTYTLTNGVPTPLGSPVATDAGPMGMSFDLTGKYLYVAAYTANAIDSYTVGSGGLPTRSAAQASTQTATGPTCVTVSGSPSNASPSHAEYLYTSNALSNNLTGELVNQQDGSLDQIQGEPFGGSALPVCTITVPALPIR